MRLEDRLKRSIAQRKDDVFVRREFESFGSSAQLSRALKALVDKGRLVKLGVGIYAKAKPSALSGRPIPIRPIDMLAPCALRKLGVAVGPSRLTLAYNMRQSTQLPAGMVFNIGQRNITRKIGFGGRFVEYEKNIPGIG
jgi:hypothetical protein